MRFALSCASQNFRSCASELNFRTLVFAFINPPLLTMHVARRDYPDSGSICSQRKRDMKSPPTNRDTQRMEPRLASRVGGIRNHQQALIEEHLFGFALRDAVFLVLPSIASVPFESGDAIDIHPERILP